jgi:dihydroorotate dehydrogenase (fumarate)
MVNLATKYMGLNLKNPIIVSSSRLTGSVETVKRCADAGAAAVVLKSLFEEQINADVRALADSSTSTFHAEEWDYIQRMGLDMNADQYLRMIEGAKEAVDIPVIASLNCISGDRWTEFAKYIEAVGADAIELNIAVMPRQFDEDPDKIEQHIYNIISKVKHNVNIPVAVKLGPYFTSLPRVAKGVRKAGASALVLFNRFYQTDIDIKSMTHESKNKYSSPAEMANTLRWISLLYQQIGCSLVGNTGIHTGEDVIKQILVGAKAVGICSTLFINGLGRINFMLDDLTKWMLEKGYGTLDDFRGNMSFKNSKQPEYFERQQYIKALVGID